MTKDQNFAMRSYLAHLRKTGGRFYPIGSIVSPDEAMKEVTAILKDEDIELAIVNNKHAPDDALELVFDNLLEGRLVALYLKNELSPEMAQQLRYIADGIMFVWIHGKLEEFNPLPTKGQLIVIMNDTVYQNGQFEDSLTSMFRV